MRRTNSRLHWPAFACKPTWRSAKARAQTISSSPCGRSAVPASAPPTPVNQLLALARAESSGTVLAHQPCDLAKLTMDVVRDCVPRAMEKSIDLGYEGVEAGTPGVSIQGNITLLKEMVRNLVDNAIDYTPSTEERAGVITARVLLDPFSGALVLQVEDNGPGIPLAERELVFQPFTARWAMKQTAPVWVFPSSRKSLVSTTQKSRWTTAAPGHTPPGTTFTLRFSRLIEVESA